MRSWMGLTLALVALGSAGARLAGAAAPAADLIRGGSFEEADKPGIGQEWASESYGSAKIAFDLAAEKAQAGKCCQHIRAEEYQNGGIQIRQRGIARPRASSMRSRSGCAAAWKCR